MKLFLSFFASVCDCLSVCAHAVWVCVCACYVVDVPKMVWSAEGVGKVIQPTCY